MLAAGGSESRRSFRPRFACICASSDGRSTLAEICHSGRCCTALGLTPSDLNAEYNYSEVRHEA